MIKEKKLEIDRKTIVAYATPEEVERVTGVKVYEGYGLCPKQILFWKDNRILANIFINQKSIRSESEDAT